MFYPNIQNPASRKFGGGGEMFRCVPALHTQTHTQAHTPAQTHKHIFQLVFAMHWPLCGFAVA